MQFHLNGFTPGDPELAVSQRQSVNAVAPRALPEKVDVLIVGCGPAGLTLAAQLARFANIKTCIIDKKPGPLQLGQADGIACRSLEMFNAFGFAERVLKEAYWVNETVFWKPDTRKPANILRSGRVQDTEDGLSEFPHVILNQARVHDFFLTSMRQAETGLAPYYSSTLVHIEVPEKAFASISDLTPISVTVEQATAKGEREKHTMQATFVIGCDGARSQVRQSIGLKLEGDSASQLWGVMDVLVVTDFPDIRTKCLIQSDQNGSIIVIPREGGYLVRIYVELDKLAPGERVADRQLTSDDVVTAAQRVFHPYSFDVKEVVWWSAYEIGQRLCRRFDNVEIGDESTPRVFIAGDACHTHSPKAGQGMNVSMRDSFNLGWKLASVLRGIASPALLNTYSAERHGVAAELIAFDREWARIVSATGDAASAASGHDNDRSQEFQQYFVRHGRYTAGTSIQYHTSIICADTAFQYLATGFDIGTRFHSAMVTRVADAKPVQLGHVVEADGRWRLMVFDGPGEKISESIPGMAALQHHAVELLSLSQSLIEWATFMVKSAYSPLIRYGFANADIDANIDCRFIIQAPHQQFTVESLPESVRSLLQPSKGTLGLIDYEKVFSAAVRDHENIYDSRAIDKENGCVVIVRPDQHIADVLPLSATDRLAVFFDRFMLPVSA